MVSYIKKGYVLRTKISITILLSFIPYLNTTQHWLIGTCPTFHFCRSQEADLLRSEWCDVNVFKMLEPAKPLVSSIFFGNSLKLPCDDFLCLVWFSINLNCKRNEWSWINCREPEWVFNGIFQALCGVPSGCMATSCKFKSTSRRCSKRSASWTLVSWHVSSHVAVDKCWQSLGLYLWFSIAARCTPKRLLSLWRLGNKEKKRLNVSPVSERLHQKPLMTMVGYLS